MKRIVVLLAMASAAAFAADEYTLADGVLTFNVDVLAGGDVARGVSDRHAVLDDGLAGCDCAAGVLVPVVMDLDVV